MFQFSISIVLLFAWRYAPFNNNTKSNWFHFHSYLTNDKDVIKIINYKMLSLWVHIGYGGFDQCRKKLLYLLTCASNFFFGGGVHFHKESILFFFFDNLWDWLDQMNFKKVETNWLTGITDSWRDGELKTELSIAFVVKILRPSKCVCFPPPPI